MKILSGIFLLTVIVVFSAKAQYTRYGTIEFERKANVHRQMEDMMKEGDNWFEKIKSQIPKFNVSYFDYSFTTDHSIYKPGREDESQKKMRMFGAAPAADNIVYTNFKTQKITARKNVFEEQFLVQDSLQHFRWKILDEVRMIANYKCRKALTVINDSVVVVAFYTDDIMVSGGPELFSGLPGMILEIAIPRLHTIWIATKIDLPLPAAAVFEVPQKGTKLTQDELYDRLIKSVSRWGNWGSRSIWWSML